MSRLQRVYGRPQSPSADPWRSGKMSPTWRTMNVARRAFEQFIQGVGTAPDRILAASDETLGRVGSFGIMAKKSVQKLRRCAEIARDTFGGDLRAILKKPISQAKRDLMKFPGIGEPGAEKILLFCRSHKVFALDSNALRVLQRLGYAQEQKNYAQTYRLVQEAIAPEPKSDFGWRIRAHQLLRRHGQEICRRSRPLCCDCPLAPDCPDYQNRLPL